MKHLHILIFTISLLFTISVMSQQQQDTVNTKEKYGLRLGIDLSQPIISLLDEDVKGVVFRVHEKGQPDRILVE